MTRMASTKKTLITAGLLLAFGVGSAQASVIPEDEITSPGNNSVANSQNVESGFSTGANANIENANIGWEWVSITSQENGVPPFPPGSNLPLKSLDNYSFNVRAGQQFVFDIDFGGVASGEDPVSGGDMDSFLQLFDEVGRLLASGDDQDTLDPGSVSFFDTKIPYTFAYTGIATIEISDAIETELIEYSSYQMQISRSLTPSAVPVPAAIWLFGSALIGFVGMSRRTSIKA